MSVGIQDPIESLRHVTWRLPRIGGETCPPCRRLHQELAHHARPVLVAG